MKNNRFNERPNRSIIERNHRSKRLMSLSEYLNIKSRRRMNESVFTQSKLLDALEVTSDIFDNEADTDGSIYIITNDENGRNNWKVEKQNDLDRFYAVSATVIATNAHSTLGKGYEITMNIPKNISLDKLTWMLSKIASED